MLKQLLCGAAFAAALALPAQSPLTTLFTGGNGLGTGSTIYFDVVLNAPLTFTQIDVNSSSTASTTGSIEVRWVNGTYVGNDTNAGVWTLGGSGPVVAVGANMPTPCTLSPFTLPPGNYGFAVTFLGVGQSYTDGNGTATPGSGSNQTYSTNEMTLLAGASAGGAVGTAICCVPRVFNGNIHYSVGSGGTVATRATYGTGCYHGIATFYETFATNTFDLGSTTGTNSIMMVPSGGGYTVMQGSNQWFTPTSSNLALGDDVVSAAQTLPFTFTTASGLQTTSLYVVSNGYVWPAANTNAGCCNGDPALLRSLPESFRVMWMDMAPHNGGTVHFDVDPTGTAVYVTWLSVPEYGNLTNLCTFQAMFDISGIVEYRWQQCANITHTALVGWSPGNNARDPGATDLSTALPIATVADSYGLALAASARPILGSTFSLDTSSIPAGSAFGATILSFAQIAGGVSTAGFGMPGCFQYVGLDVSMVFLVNGTTGSLPMALPNDPGFIGLHIYCQSASFSPGVNPLGALSSNGLDLGLGDL